MFWALGYTAEHARIRAKLAELEERHDREREEWRADARRLWANSELARSEVRSLTLELIRNGIALPPPSEPPSERDAPFD